MSEIGKAVRKERIINRKTGKTVIVPMDHGVSVGPIAGLVSMPEAVNKVAEGGANAVILHKGVVRYGHRGYGKDIGLIIHLSGSTTYSPDPNNKVLVTTVKEAVQLGADCVSVHINIGAEDEALMLKNLGSTAMECAEYGMPLLAMMYPRGKKIPSEHDPNAVKVAARAGAELGADIIKTNYTGDIESFKEVVKGCPVPVVIAGGPKAKTDKDVLQMVYDALQAGASGTSIGRNIFQHANPIKMTRAICAIVHEKASVNEAIKMLAEK